LFSTQSPDGLFQVLVLVRLRDSKCREGLMRSDTSEGRLVPKREVDPATGTPNITYYWEGRLVPKIQISGRLVDHLSGYSLIKKDLDSALKWIRLAETIANTHRKADEEGYQYAPEREDFDVVKAYFVASLTFYGKCFTEASGRHAQISRDWLDEAYRDVHDFYISYRHNFAAHSGDERLEMAATYVLVHPDGQSLLPYLATARSQPDIALPGKGKVGFGDLIAHVADKVVTKYNKAAQNIIHNFVVPAGVEYWSSAAEKGAIVQVNIASKGKAKHTDLRRPS
jgi:hypothetical protein